MSGREFVNRVVIGGRDMGGPGTVVRGRGGGNPVSSEIRGISPPPPPSPNRASSHDIYDNSVRLGDIRDGQTVHLSIGGGTKAPATFSLFSSDRLGSHIHVVDGGFQLVEIPMLGSKTLCLLYHPDNKQEVTACVFSSFYFPDVMAQKMFAAEPQEEPDQEGVSLMERSCKQFQLAKAAFVKE